MSARRQIARQVLLEGNIIAAIAGVGVRLVAVARRRGEDGSIVGVVDDEEPRSVLLVAEPVVDQLEHIGLWILPAASLDVVGYLPVALLEPRRVAGVRPEDPRRRRSFGGAIAVLDGQLRLAVLALGSVRALAQGLLGLPNTAQAYQRYAGGRRRATFAYLIEQRSAVDEIWVASEREEARGLGWSLGTFCGKEGG